MRSFDDLGCFRKSLLGCECTFKGSGKGIAFDEGNSFDELVSFFYFSRLILVLGKEKNPVKEGAVRG